MRPTAGSCWQKQSSPRPTAWRAERRGKGLDIGRLPEHDLRRIMDAIRYVDRTGIPWGTCLTTSPHGKPSNQLNGLLRRLVRKAEGRNAEPSACVLDAQSIKTSANVPATGQGIDAGKKIAGANATSVSTHSAFS